MGNYNQRVKRILLNSGWHEEIDMSDAVSQTLLYSLFPPNIINFYNEFVGLKIKETDTFIGSGEEITIKDFSYLNNIKVFEYYSKKYSFHVNIDLELGEQDDIYYYSCLLGTQLYRIANLRDNEFLFIDEFDNFYVLSQINTFFWIANKCVDAFDKLLFGQSDSIFLNEDDMKWEQSEKHTKIIDIPLNKSLQENPW